MAKVRVPVAGTVGKSIMIDPNPVTQEQLTAALAALSVSSSTTPSGFSATLWRLIREVPANIVKLAALATSGLITRKSDGSIITRSIATASSARITVANGDGGAGNPTLDLATLSPSAGGTLQVFTADTYGRISAVNPAVIDDLADVDTSSVAPSDGDALTWSSAGSKWVPATGGGGGGGGWTLVVDEDGSSLAHFTTDSGTWAVTGGVIEATTSGASFGRLRYTNRIPSSYMVMEVEVNVASTSRNVAISVAGMIFNWDGSGDSGFDARMDWNSRNPASNGVITNNLDAISTLLTTTNHFALDTWHKLRVVRAGTNVDVYFNGTYLVSASYRNVASQVDCGFIGFNAFDADDVFFRNLKVWIPTPP